jgi:hypothetical protein
MLDQGDEPVGHEPARADGLARARYLADLDHSARGHDLDPASCAGREKLECLDTLAGVDHSLDAIALHCRTSGFMGAR